MQSSFFETIKVVAAKPLHMSYHQKRYERVLDAFGIKEAKNLQEYISPSDMGVYRCRIDYTLILQNNGSQALSHEISVSYHPYKKREIHSLKLIFNNEIEYDKKSAQRDSLDALYAQKGEGDDVLIIKNLLVTDTTIANIAFFKDGMWITPKHPLLKGTTRERLLEEKKIIEADIPASELRSFKKVALLNAMIDFEILQKCEFLL